MSSDSNAELISEFESLLINGYCNFAAITLLVYEFLITFGQEVQLFWKGKWSGATILFFLNSCKRLVVVDATVHFLQYIPWAFFSALRAFALSNQNWPLSIFVLLLGLVPLATNFANWAFGPIAGVNDPVFGCFEEEETPSAVAQQFVIATRTCLIAQDIILLALTWYRVPKPRKISNSLTDRVGSISSVLLRDGTIYFGVLAILNALHLAFTVASLTIRDALLGVSFVPEFSEPLTAILVSRFLIDLQAANQRTVRILRDDNMFSSGIDGEDSEDCTTTTLSFAGFDVVGSLGTQLKPGEHASFGISTDDSDALEGMDRFRDEDGMEMSPIDSKAAGSC